MKPYNTNNFDFLRFFAASLVWYSHSFALIGLNEPSPLPFASAGGLGVSIFFVISGYFITASYLNHKSFCGFLKNRFLRIMPALIVVVILSVFILGMCVTTLRISTYFSSETTWLYLESIGIFWVKYYLPGVFTNNPVLPAVNGSLWTLEYEVVCYGTIALLGLLRLLRPTVIGILLAVLFMLRILEALHFPINASHLSIWLTSLFMGGAFIYLMQKHLPFRKSYFAIAATIMLIIAQFTGVWANIAFDIVLPYFILFIGFFSLPIIRSFSKKGDFSYGMYLYAFPIQQLVLYVLGRNYNFYFFLLTSFIGTLFCAVLSWHFIEKPALEKKYTAS